MHYTRRNLVNEQTSKFGVAAPTTKTFSYGLKPLSSNFQNKVALVFHHIVFDQNCHAVVLTLTFALNKRSHVGLLWPQSTYIEPREWKISGSKMYDSESEAETYGGKVFNKTSLTIGKLMLKNIMLTSLREKIQIARSATPKILARYALLRSSLRKPFPVRSFMAWTPTAKKFYWRESDVINQTV